MAKKRKQERKKSWCWYCDREFDDDKILFQHQRMKHFKCNTCHRKLNSASGLVIHMAQVHKETMEKVPNAVDGHDSAELEIYCMDGVPEEDLQRHFDGLPIVPYTKGKLIIGDASILPILAAQKASVAAQLAESKNMTVQGDLGGGIAGVGGSGIVSPSGGVISPVMGSSANSVVSPPLPAVAVNSTGPVAGQADYWNNPYVMAAYYQQQAQSQAQVQGYGNQSGYSNQQQAQQYNPQQYNPQQYNAQQLQQQQQAYAQYYQAYAQFYNQHSVPAPVKVEPAVPAPPVEEVETESGPLMIPAHVDPRTNKVIPGTIFTVLNLDRSVEEIRSEMKRYRTQ